MPAYAEKYPVGSEVQIADRIRLEEFRADWTFHNPLQLEQLDWADRRDTVAQVGFYHGGDLLYTLNDAPGVWHESCLTSIDERAT